MELHYLDMQELMDHVLSSRNSEVIHSGMYFNVSKLLARFCQLNENSKDYTIQPTH